ncbi:MAG: phage tail tube protein [Pseudomonadota bacterium]
MSDALTGYGSEFWLGATALALTEMGELIAIDPGAQEWGTAETTHFKSPDRTEEFIKTMRNGGSGSFQLNWLPGSPTDQKISEADASPDAWFYKMVVPSTSGTWEITGSVLVLSRTPTIELKDRMTCNVSLQFTGKRDEAAGT